MKKILDNVMDKDWLGWHNSGLYNNFLDRLVGVKTGKKKGDRVKNGQLASCIK